jgi:isopentenyldiphosphate isomerase
MSWPSVSVSISYHDRCPDQVSAYQYLTMTDVLTKCQHINILPWPISWPSISLSISNHDRYTDKVISYKYDTWSGHRSWLDIDRLTLGQDIGHGKILIGWHLVRTSVMVGYWYADTWSGHRSWLDTTKCQRINILPWPMSWPSVSLSISNHDRCPDQVSAYQYLTMTDVLTKRQPINILPWPMSWPSVSLSISNHDRCPDQVLAYQYLTMTDVLTKRQRINILPWPMSWPSVSLSISNHDRDIDRLTLGQDIGHG